MTSAQVVETSVTNNSSFQNYPHPDDQTIRTTGSLLYIKAEKANRGGLLHGKQYFAKGVFFHYKALYGEPLHSNPLVHTGKFV